MNWYTVGSLRRGRIKPPEQLSEQDALKATASLFAEQRLGIREWTTRWDLLNSTPEEQFA